jgi:hypothetical protein
MFETTQKCPLYRMHASDIRGGGQATDAARLNISGPRISNDDNTDGESRRSTYVRHVWND